MKSIFFILFALLAMNVKVQEIKIKGTKLYVEGKRVSDRKVNQIMKNTDAPAYQDFQVYKQKSTFGGLLLGLGSGLIIGDLFVGLTTVHDYPGAITYVGLASIAGSIPVLVGRKKKLQKAINTYNNKALNQTTHFDNEINIIANKNGIGFQISL